MKAIGTFLGIVIILGLVITILFGVGVLNLERRRFFEPRNAEIDRTVFENTPSYVQGKITYLTRLENEYKLADTPAKKESLRQVILHEASTVSTELLPFHLNQFITSIR